VPKVRNAAIFRRGVFNYRQEKSGGLRRRMNKPMKTV
jgi:hypothetical protein